VGKGGGWQVHCTMYISVSRKEGANRRTNMQGEGGGEDAEREEKIGLVHGKLEHV
jgi:hypothetical protein